MFFILLNWVYNLQYVLLIFGVLILTIFLPSKVETLVFSHRLGFGYLILNAWLIKLEQNFQLEKNLKIPQQENPFFPHLVFFFISLIVATFFYGVLDRIFIQNGDETEFTIVISFIAMGTFFLFNQQNLIEFLLAIETVTLASYVCTGYERQKAQSTYASIQYFILGAIPSGILILSLSLLYSYTGILAIEDLDLFLYETYEIQNSFNSVLNSLYTQGSQNFTVIFNGELKKILMDNSWSILDEKTKVLEEIISPRSSTLILALFFLLFNLLFKLTAAPFHFWAPSVYKYAPISTVTYLSIISKTMVIFLIIKIFLTVFYSFILIISPVIFFCIVLTITVGFIGAFIERTIKVFYVYSSMGHVGFMLIGCAFFTISGLNATLHYLIIYIISSFIMWFVLLDLGATTTFLISFRELKKTYYFVAIIFALFVFSMSGLPPLAGFFIKLNVLSVLLENSRFGINAILFFFTVASFFYYLRLNKIIFFDETKIFASSKEKNTSRFQLIIIFFFCLFFYIIMVETSLFLIQSKMLSILME